MKYFFLSVCFFISFETFSISNVYSDSIICNDCAKVNRIDFWYLGWDFNPVTNRDEESVRSNREKHTHFFSIHDKDSINAVLVDYFDCSNRNYDVHDETSVVMIIELVMENNDIHKILVSHYFTLHDRYGSNYSNLTAILKILKYVPNTNTRIEKKEK